MGNERTTRQLVILSGKGGTGKTTLAAAFSRLAENSVITDCDVDAADLFILLKPETKEALAFFGGKKASINKVACTRCGLCMQICRFDAIRDFLVDDILCEGCGFCFRVCPDEAIEFNKVISGNYYDCRIANDAEFLYAKLLPGEGSSGKLVAELKKKASGYFERNKRDWFIVDGPPGIGCPVNASLSGADSVVLITEPTLSGLHDLKRIIKLIQSFKIQVAVVINKFDLNEEITESIETFLGIEGIPVKGKIPFDERVLFALQQEKDIMDVPESNAAKEIRTIWNSL